MQCAVNAVQLMHGQGASGNVLEQHDKQLLSTYNNFFETLQELYSISRLCHVLYRLTDLTYT